MIPEKPSDGNWLAWVEKHYPFDEEWSRHLLTRRERPAPGSAEQLDDLRGVPSRETAAMLASVWFYIVANVDKIEREQRAAQEQAREKERRRLISIANQALDGKLGDTRDQRDAAQATAQQFLGNRPPDQLDFDDLADWEKMHQYAKALAQGGNPKRPVLARELREKARQRRELDDINRTIDASPAGRPQRRQAEQRELYG